jgi:hypothetical protein
MSVGIAQKLTGRAIRGFKRLTREWNVKDVGIGMKGNVRIEVALESHTRKGGQLGMATEPVQDLVARVA